jgi:hypothetical protein
MVHAISIMEARSIQPLISTRCVDITLMGTIVVPRDPHRTTCTAVPQRPKERLEETALRREAGAYITCSGTDRDPSEI